MMGEIGNGAEEGRERGATERKKEREKRRGGKDDIDSFQAVLHKVEEGATWSAHILESQ